MSNARVPASVAAAAAANESPGLFFQCRYTANVRVDDHVLRLEKADPPLVVEIRRGREEDVSKHVRLGETISIATVWMPAPRGVREWLADLEKPIPDRLTTFGHEALRELSGATQRAATLARWRVGEREERRAIKFFIPPFEWSTDGNGWHRADAGLQLGGTIRVRDKAIGPEVLDDITTLWRSDAQEPLAHEMLGEAWSQTAENPRSALIMAIAAAETGIKHLIAELVPDATWLIENLQSPPLEKLLVEYLPKLPTRYAFNGKVLPPSDSVVAQIRKGVSLRNEIIHGRREESISGQPLVDMLVAVRDVLYLIDAYSGQAWAETRLSHETRQWIRERISGEVAGLERR